MIKICFPHGCYGNYLAQCLYHFTELNISGNDNFTFDSRGSSHAYIDNVKANEYILAGHLGHFVDVQKKLEPFVPITAEDVVVSIVPAGMHFLDYHNNHFVKYLQSNTMLAMLDIYSDSEINHKLTTQWNYHNGFSETVPIWILREMVSFAINDVLNVAYNQPIINNSIVVNAQDFFENFLDVFKNLCKQLQLTITVNDKTILQNNKSFIAAQRCHNSQLMCEQWTHCVIDNKSASLNQATFFDEAYVQYCLRQLGYEIQCNGLDVFPVDSRDMTKLIYKTNTHETMHHTNT
jgi:hypothetical protein